MTSVIGDSITPGCTEFTRTAWRPTSRAAVFVIPRTAHFDAVYAADA